MFKLRYAKKESLMSNKIGIWALALIFCGLIAGDARAGHDWNNYHWANKNTAILLKVVNSTTRDWPLTQTLDKWSASLGYTQVFTFGIDRDDTSRKARKRCSAVSGQMRVCNAAYGYNGWLGLASIYLDAEGHITRGTAKVNDSYSSYWAINGEKNHVMCQEIGHVFGLGHTSENGSVQGTCMDYSSDPSSQWPNAHDFEMLAGIYVHFDDAYNSYDDTPIGGGGGSDPKPCRGKKCSNFGAQDVPPMGVRVHKGRNHEIWVARGPGKSGWIHHVRLVPEKYRQKGIK